MLNMMHVTGVGCKGSCTGRLAQVVIGGASARELTAEKRVKAPVQNPPRGFAGGWELSDSWKRQCLFYRAQEC